MSFSLPRFLRRTQASDLQTYFVDRDINLSEQVEWTAKPAAILDSLKAAIEALPERTRERVFEDFERIDQLSDEIGQRALQSLIVHDEALLHKFHSCNGSEARGLFVLLANEEAFDNALATAYAERMRHGRSWSGYRLPAPLAPSKNPSDIALLEGDLSALYREFDGTGRKLKIESFERRTADFPGDPCRNIIHYSVYVEGLPECSIEFARDELKRRTRRPVIERINGCPVADPCSGSPASALVSKRLLLATRPSAAMRKMRSRRWFPLALPRLNSCVFRPSRCGGLTVPVQSFSAERQSELPLVNPRKSDPP